MPVVNRDPLFNQLMVESLQSHSIVGKLAQIGATILAMIGLVIPQKIAAAIVHGKDRRNIGHITPIVGNQIYQQQSFSGLTNCTILRNRHGNKLLIYIPPKMTKEFIADVHALDADVQFIVAHNEAHESFADDCKQGFPKAKVLTPRPSREMVQEAVKIDETLEDAWDTLQRDYGFTQEFKFDAHSRCTSERSFAIELFGNSTTERQHCLFVAQCGVGNYSRLNIGMLLAGFQTLFKPTGRWFRLYKNCFTINPNAIHKYWHHMIESVENMEAAVFTHGTPITGSTTLDQLRSFYVY